MPFRGVACSDAAGKETGYAAIVSTLESPMGQQGSGIMYDTESGTVWYSYTDANGDLRQVKSTICALLVF